MQFQFMDDENILQVKVDKLAHLLSSSKHAIIYTGAGISTSANIPDYRGVDGVWTQISAGQDIKMGKLFKLLGLVILQVTCIFYKF